MHGCIGRASCCRRFAQRQIWRGTAEVPRHVVGFSKTLWCVVDVEGVSFSYVQPVAVIVVIANVDVVSRLPEKDQASLSKTSELFLYSEHQEKQMIKYPGSSQAGKHLDYYTTTQDVSALWPPSRHTIIIARAGQKWRQGASTDCP